MNGFPVASRRARPPARPVLQRWSRLTRLPRPTRREERTMKSSKHLLALCLLAAFWLGPTIASAQEARKDDQTLSPYFVVEGADPSLDPLPLKDTRVELTVVGVIADVTVRQVYENRGSRPIHARYVFPASTRAAVYAMSMIIRDKRIVAKIEERERGQQHFEQAKRQGKSASLLEQSRPNVF